MSAPMSSLRMSKSAASSRFERRAHRRRSVSVDGGDDVQIECPRRRIATNVLQHRVAPHAVRASARASSAAYPSSPTERRRFSDTPANARCIASPSRRRFVSPEPFRARVAGGRTTCRSPVDPGFDIPLCAPLSRGDIASVQSTSHRRARAIARTGERRAYSVWDDRARRTGYLLAPSRREYAAICSRVCSASFSITLRT